MKPRVLLFACLLLVVFAAAWWRVGAARDAKKISTLLELESADIAHRKSKGEVDAILKLHPESGSPAARERLAALLPDHPESDYLRYQLARVLLQSPGPEVPAALAVLAPCRENMRRGGLPHPANLGARLALELGYAGLLSGANEEAEEAFANAERLAAGDDRKRIDREIAERRATAFFFRRSSIGFARAGEQLRGLRNRWPDNPVVWEMLARHSLEDPADRGRLAREALPRLRDKRLRGEIERLLAALPAPPAS